MLRKKIGLFYIIFGWLLRQTLGRYLRIKVQGAHNLPVRTPCILAANHPSLLDPPMICAYLIPPARCMISPAATKGLFVGPFGWILRGMDAFIIDRQDNRNLAAVRSILRRLKDEHPVLIFPEGGVTQPDEERKVRTGVGFIAAKAGVPVVPVAIHGSNRALPKGAWFIRPHRVTIRVGEPLIIDKSRDHAATANRIMNAVHAEYAAMARPQA
ncbi:MAG: lysophospholipid acyltransferase family protein [Acidobacteriota bacterium]|nr:lysophospholipid acyltransferase family protein [Acidobacteriota bacterium]